MFRRKSSEVHISVSNRTIIRIIGFGIATYAGFRFFDNIRHPLTLIFVSFFLAMALNPAVGFVTRKLKSKSRIRGTAVAYIAVITILISFFSFVIPPLIKQSTQFVEDVPGKIQSLESQDSSIGKFVRKYDLSVQLDKFANDWSNNLGNASGPVLNTANKIVSAVVSFITILILTFMMLVEGPYWIGKILTSLPRDKQVRTKQLLIRMYDLVTNFVNAQLLIALISAFFALIALTISSSILHVTVNVVALAGLVALFGIIPTIGNIIAATVVGIACLFTSAPLAVIMVIYFIIYLQIENATIHPYIQSRKNDLSPLLVFVAAILGIGFGGLMGGFVAIPAAGCIKILLEDYLDDKIFNNSTAKDS